MYIAMESCPEWYTLYELETLALKTRVATGETGSVNPEELRKALYWASCQLCTHLLNSITMRDPWTARPLPQPLHDSLLNLSHVASQGIPDISYDALCLLSERCSNSLAAILENPRQRHVRQHLQQALYRARDLDTKCVMWLARQPGNSVQEKTGSRQRTLATVRAVDRNTLENRVVRRVAHDLSKVIKLRLGLLDTLGLQRPEDFSKFHGDKPEQAASPASEYLADKRRLRVLKDTLDLTTIGIEEAQLSDVPLVEVRDANNVLLSHRDYHRIWRTWLELGHFNRTLKRSWDEGPARFVTSAYWLMISRLIVQYNGTPFNDRFVAGAGLGLNEIFGLRTVGPADATPIQGSLIEAGAKRAPRADEETGAPPGGPVDVWIDHVSRGQQQVAEQTLLRCSIADGEIRIVYYRLRGSGWFPLEGTDEFERRGSVTVRIEPDFSGKLNEQRLCPLLVHLRGSSRKEVSFSTYADVEGFDQLITRIFNALVEVMPPRSNFVRSGTHDAEPQVEEREPLRYLSIDASGAIPRVHSEHGSVQTNHMTSARLEDLSEFGKQWIVANNERNFRSSVVQDEWQSVPSILAKPGKTREVAAEQSLSMQEICSAIWNETAKDDMNAELAIAVPAQLPDFLQQRLRLAAGHGFSKTWMVERSTAAGMGWQTLRAFPGIQQATAAESTENRRQLRDGDRVLIADAEAGTFRFSTLKVCLTETNDSMNVVWERDIANDAQWPSNRNLSYQAWLEEFMGLALNGAANHSVLSSEEEKSLIHNLVVQGEAERLVQSKRTIRVPIPINDPSGYFCLPPEKHIADSASDAWVRKYRMWLRQVCNELTARIIEIQRETPDGSPPPRWHILYVGRPFHRSSVYSRVADQGDNNRYLPTIAEVWEKVFSKANAEFFHHTVPNADFLVSIGAREFLRRFHNNPRLPTWRDVLPDLYLEVDGDNGPQPRKILEKATKSPGDNVDFTIEENLSLPPFQSQYVLPVIQGNNQDISYNAVLRPPGFPYRAPLAVSMSVHYQYGEDNYRLTVSPAEGQPRLFDKIEMDWTELDNAAPEFSSSGSSNYAPNRWADLKKAFYALPKDMPEIIRDFVRTVQNLPMLDQADLLVTQANMREWHEYIDLLLGLWQEQVSYIDERNVELRASGQIHILTDKRRTVGEAISCMIRFLAATGQTIPDSTIMVISSKLLYKGWDSLDVSGAALRMLEPVVRNPEISAHQQAFRNVAEILHGRFSWLQGSDPHLLQEFKMKTLNRPLSMLSVAISTDSRFALLLENDRKCNSILNIIESTLQAIKATLNKAMNSTAPSPVIIPERPVQQVQKSNTPTDLSHLLRTYRNACELLLGMLCLRELSTKPGIQEQFAAGSARMHALAKLTSELYCQFEGLNVTNVAPRITMERKSDTQSASSGMKDLVQVLYFYLAGYNPGRLVQIEDDSD